MTSLSCMNEAEERLPPTERTARSCDHLIEEHLSYGSLEEGKKDNNNLDVDLQILLNDLKQLKEDIGVIQQSNFSLFFFSFTTFTLFSTSPTGNAERDFDKRFEVSFLRMLAIMTITYLTIYLYMKLVINVSDPELNAVVPTIGFNLSTWSLPSVKRIWRALQK
jgi:hypothetical protein